MIRGWNLVVNEFWFMQVLDFTKGRLQNLYWKRDGCAKCSGNSSFVCLNNQDCAIKTNSCKNKGGNVDCSLGIQLAFSGTDKHLSVLNSWYEVKNLGQYSLYGLYSNLKDSLTSQYNKFFWLNCFSQILVIFSLPTRFDRLLLCVSFLCML